MEAAAMELEDDLFFKDLSKQISLLIMDDDDDDQDQDQDPLFLSPPLINLQAFSQAINPTTQAASYFSYDSHQTSKRESKGTGVFIPRSTSNPRRKSVKQARLMASGNNKFQRPCDHSSRGMPHDYMINPYYDNSINFRRF